VELNTHPPSSAEVKGRVYYISTYFSKKEKQRETIKIVPHLARILVPKNCPREKI
jgi:hypothetical protein